MPKKVRELKAMLRQAGFVERTAKGSHKFFTHPSAPGVAVSVPGKDGDDAKRYLEKQVKVAIEQVESK
jgi:predicted RNA binding protein YcfA (HicA-like mRNA interferase family)